MGIWATRTGYVCTYIYIFIHTYIYIHILIYIYICIYIYTCIYIHIYIHIYIQIYIYIHIYIHIYTYIYIQIYVYIYVHVCIHVYIYIDMYIYIMDKGTYNGIVFPKPPLRPPFWRESNFWSSGAHSDHPAAGYCSGLRICWEAQFSPAVAVQGWEEEGVSQKLGLNKQLILSSWNFDHTTGKLECPWLPRQTHTFFAQR